MTDTTEHHHEWDKAVDRGSGWNDQLVSYCQGKSVFVTRNIDSPEEHVEHVRLVFPDGSRLYIGIDGEVPVRRALDSGQAEHWTDVADVDATSVYAQFMKPINDNASLKQLDTDL